MPIRAFLHGHSFEYERAHLSVRGAAYVAVVSARPHPGPILRCDLLLGNAPDHDAVLQHVVVVVAPLAGRARGRCV
jgi:hypothetical protein